MALKTNVEDRVSAYPGRVKLTPVSGYSDTYDMVRADQPTQEGTPINKAFLDKKADALTGNITLYVRKSGNDSTGDGSSTAPFLTIQAALDYVPKNLNGHHLYINIGAGTYDEAVSVEYFVDGRVIFTGATGAAVTLLGTLIVRKTGLNVEDIALTVSGTYVYVTEQGWLNVDSSASLTCTGGVYGLNVRYGSHACLLGNFTVNNTTNSAVRVGENSSAYLFEATGSGNVLGIYAQGGQVWVRLQSIGATTEYGTAHGGRIYNGSQVSVPRY